VAPVVASSVAHTHTLSARESNEPFLENTIPPYLPAKFKIFTLPEVSGIKWSTESRIKPPLGSRSVAGGASGTHHSPSAAAVAVAQ